MAKKQIIQQVEMPTLDKTFDLNVSLANLDVQVKEGKISQTVADRTKKSILESSYAMGFLSMKRPTNQRNPEQEKVNELIKEGNTAVNLRQSWFTSPKFQEAFKQFTSGKIDAKQFKQLTDFRPKYVENALKDFTTGKFAAAEAVSKGIYNAGVENRHWEKINLAQEKFFEKEKQKQIKIEQQEKAQQEKEKQKQKQAKQKLIGGAVSDIGSAIGNFGNYIEWGRGLRKG